MTKTPLIITKHWLGFFTETLILISLSLVPLIWAWFSLNQPDINLPPGSMFSAGIAFGLWLMILWWFFFLAWTDWRLEYWLVANNQLITVGQWLGFNREIKTFNLSSIQSIDILRPFSLARTFNLGQLKITLIGGQEIISPWFEHPAAIKQQLLAASQ